MELTDAQWNLLGKAGMPNAFIAHSLANSWVGAVRYNKDRSPAVVRRDEVDASVVQELLNLGLLTEDVQVSDNSTGRLEMLQLRRITFIGKAMLTTGSRTLLEKPAGELIVSNQAASSQ